MNKDFDNILSNTKWNLAIFYYNGIGNYTKIPTNYGILLLYRTNYGAHAGIYVNCHADRGIYYYSGAEWNKI